MELAISPLELDIAGWPELYIERSSGGFLSTHNSLQLMDAKGQHVVSPT
jgi:hypothetical protein